MENAYSLLRNENLVVTILRNNNFLFNINGVRRSLKSISRINVLCLSFVLFELF